MDLSHLSNNESCRAKHAAEMSTMTKLKLGNAQGMHFVRKYGIPSDACVLGFVDRLGTQSCLRESIQL